MVILGLILLLWIVFGGRGDVNPYIKEHEARMRNDELYEDYLDWAKSKKGLIIEKLKSQEDVDSDRDIKDLFK